MEKKEGGAASGPGLDTTLTYADIESNWDEAVDSFDDMNLREDLLRGIYAVSFLLRLNDVLPP